MSKAHAAEEDMNRKFQAAASGENIAKVERSEENDQSSDAVGGEVEVIPQGHGGSVTTGAVTSEGGKRDHTADKGTRRQRHSYRGGRCGEQGASSGARYTSGFGRL
jgi:hypothetical protein